jgi:hypothetical protein
MMDGERRWSMHPTEVTDDEIPYIPAARLMKDTTVHYKV